MKRLRQLFGQESCKQRTKHAKECGAADNFNFASNNPPKSPAADGKPPADGLARQLLPQFNQVSQLCCSTPEGSICSNTLGPACDVQGSHKPAKACAVKPQQPCKSPAERTPRGVSRLLCDPHPYKAPCLVKPAEGGGAADFSQVASPYAAPIGIGTDKCLQNTSPYAVQAMDVPAKQGPSQDPALAAEDPSSRERAEQVLQTLNCVEEWKLLKLLGMGGMSNVYLAQDKHHPRCYCAIKLSKDFIWDVKDKQADPCYQATLLEWETYQRIHNYKQPEGGCLLDILSSNQAEHETSQQESDGRARRYMKVARPTQKTAAGRGLLPLAYGYGFVENQQSKKQHGWLSLQLLGWNLHAVATDTDTSLTWNHFLQLATGMLEAVKLLHLRGMVHRDIKPGNFCLGATGACSPVYLVDFGFVQPLPKKGDDLSEEKFCGTPDFASTNALQGGKCGPKDDCESLCYSYLQLWNHGIVPWDITQLTPTKAGMPAPKQQASSSLCFQDQPSSIFEQHAGTPVDASLFVGWSPERLQRMAEKRARIWAGMEAKGVIPAFLLSWQLYLSRLGPWEMPSYELLQKLLGNSCRSWDEHHPTLQLYSSPEPSISSIPSLQKANPLLAPEE